jgi:hypothetical protein
VEIGVRGVVGGPETPAAEQFGHRLAFVLVDFTAYSSNPIQHYLPMHVVKWCCVENAETIYYCFEPEDIIYYSRAIYQNRN